MSRATINYRPIIARVPDAIINARRSFRFRNLPTSFRGSENTFFFLLKRFYSFVIIAHGHARFARRRYVLNSITFSPPFCALPWPELRGTRIGVRAPHGINKQHLPRPPRKSIYEQRIYFFIVPTSGGGKIYTPQVADGPTTPILRRSSGYDLFV